MHGMMKSKIAFLFIDLKKIEVNFCIGKQSEQTFIEDATSTNNQLRTSDRIFNIKIKIDDIFN